MIVSGDQPKKEIDQKEFKKEDWKINKEDFDMSNKQRLAATKQSKIYLVKQISTNKECIMKETIYTIKDIANNRYFNREIKILATNQHPAIVPFIGYDERASGKKKNAIYGYIYLLKMEKGSLLDNIISNNKAGEKDPLWDNKHKFIITFGVACAMEFLHSHNIIHRDLKPDNILLDSQLQPYVTDFGTSKDIIYGNSAHQTIMNTTVYIMAPEFFTKTKLCKNTLPLDVYAFGITLYYLWTGMFPYSSNIDYKISQEVLSGNRPRIPNEMHKGIAHLIEHCWSQEPSDRPTFTQVVDELLSTNFSNENTSPEFINYFQKVEMYRPNHLQHPSNIINNSNNQQEKMHSEEEEEQKSSESSIKKIDQKVNISESPVIESLRNSTKLGNLSSELDLALALYQGTYDTVNKEEAVEHFLNVANKSEKSSEQGLAEYYYGIYRLDNNDFKGAEKFLRRSRSHGNPDAAFTLAKLIKSEKINKKSQDDYFSLLEMASKNGIKAAVKMIVSLLLDPNYSHRSKKLAFDYIKIGSDLGDFTMMHRYSNILEFGIGGREQKIDEAMNLLNFLSEFNHVPAQIDYALHLLNGFHVEKDRNQAEFILEKAANRGNPYAMLWYSMLIENDEEKSEDSIRFLNYSKDSQRVPEALAVYGQKLIENGQYKESLKYIIDAMICGSISAYISFGNICEIDNKYGDSSLYFMCASKRCHALDECGFYFPLNFKVFHCKKCNIDICEGCAKCCHKNHEIEFKNIELGCNFKCKCGEKGFVKKNQDICSAEYLSIYDIKKQGKNCIYQHLYQCETCCPNTDNIFICKSCIENCHKNHKVIDCGIQNGICSCGLKNIPNNFKCCWRKTFLNEIGKKNALNEYGDYCSQAFHPDEKINQRWFQCFDCGIYGNKDVGICLDCRKKCHEGHSCIELGFHNFCCSCVNYGNCNYC